MRAFFLMFFMRLSYLLQIGGGLAFTGLFIYALFAKSIAIRLMIGGAAVGDWVVQIVSGLLVF